jgi:hypothetical protein
MTPTDVIDAGSGVNGADASTEISPNTDQFLATHADWIRRLGRNIITDAVEIGRRLIEVNKYLEHGKWLPWLKAEFAWSETTARRFMQLSALAEAKSSKLADLNLPLSGLYVLAEPGTPEEVRDKIIERAKVEQVRHADVVAAVKKTRIDWKGNAKRFPQLFQDKRHSSPKPVPEAKPAGCVDVIALHPQAKAGAAHFSAWRDDRKARELAVVKALAAFVRFFASNACISVVTCELGPDSERANQFVKLAEEAIAALKTGESMSFLGLEEAVQ